MDIYIFIAGFSFMTVIILFMTVKLTVNLATKNKLNIYLFVLIITTLLIVSTLSITAINDGLDALKEDDWTSDYSTVSTNSYTKITFVENINNPSGCTYYVYLDNDTRYEIICTDANAIHSSSCSLKINDNNFKDCFVPAGEFYLKSDGFFYRNGVTFQNTLYVDKETYDEIHDSLTENNEKILKVNTEIETKIK